MTIQLTDRQLRYIKDALVSCVDGEGIVKTTDELTVDAQLVLCDEIISLIVAKLPRK